MTDRFSSRETAPRFLVVKEERGTRWYLISARGSFGGPEWTTDGVERPNKRDAKDFGSFNVASKAARRVGGEVEVEER